MSINVNFNNHADRPDGAHKLKNRSNEESSIFAKSRPDETIEPGYGFNNGHDIGDYAEDPTETLTPNVNVANINANPTEEEFDAMQETGDTFADIFSMVHDTYGHDLSPKEFLQVIYSIVTAPENAEVFKNVLESAEFQKFEDACRTGDESSVGYVTGFLDGTTEDLEGITLPDVDIQ